MYNQTKTERLRRYVYYDTKYKQTTYPNQNISIARSISITAIQNKPVLTVYSAKPDFYRTTVQSFVKFATCIR